MLNIAVANALIKRLTLPDAGPKLSTSAFILLLQVKNLLKLLVQYYKNPSLLVYKITGTYSYTYSLFFPIILLVMQVNEDLYGLACMTSYPSDPWLGRVGRGRQPYMGTSRLLTPPKPARKGDPVQSYLHEVLFSLFKLFIVYFPVDFSCFKNLLEEAIHSVQEKAVL